MSNAKNRRLEKNKQVRQGWHSYMRPMMARIIDDGEDPVFECRVPDPNNDPYACQCEGCIATRAAWQAIDWIDEHIP